MGEWGRGREGERHPPRVWSVTVVTCLLRDPDPRRSALYEETALLDTDFQDLVDAGMINGSPAQVGLHYTTLKPEPSHEVDHSH